MTAVPFNASLGGAHAASTAPSGAQRLWRRELTSYPANGQRYFQLGVVVIATIILYYENYINGAVGTQILSDYHMSFTYFVNILVISNALGAFASLFAGLGDRLGRANLVTGGLLVTGLITLVGVPNSHSKLAFGVMISLLGIFEGIILVATPALVRDFSPQLGRASAMGFWTLGPVMGSLVVSEVSSHTLPHLPAWRDQFTICGVVGMVVFVLALFCLRELSPRIRDQLMVSLHDKELIEARANDLDVKALHGHGFGRVLKPDVIISAVAISVFLLSYYTAVAFFPIFFQTVQGFSESQANGLLNYYWASNAIALIVVGILSDRALVRKPFMLVGGAGAILTSAFIITRIPKSTTSYHAWAFLLVLVGVYGGFAFACWMASFTETVEARSPALVGTGLAVWGWILRAVVAISFLVLPHVVSSVTTLVQDGPTAKALLARNAAVVANVQAHPDIIAQLQSYGTRPIPPAVLDNAIKTVGAPTLQSLQDPKVKADLGYLQTTGAKVQAASAETGRQWQHWFWVCLAGQLFFLPAVFILRGPWSTRKAREDAAAHEARVNAELSELSQRVPAPRGMVDLREPTPSIIE